MLLIALRGIRNNPFRYIATVIAIVLGVAFFVATGVLTTSFRESINSSITEAFEDVDAAVRSTQTIDADFFEIRSRIPASTADEIDGLPGVADAEPYLAGYAQAVTADGKVVDGGGANAQGFAWIEEPDLNPYRIVDGSAPATADEVVIDEDTFTDGDFALGDSIRVLPLPADQQFTLVGTIAADSSSDFGGQVLSFSFDGAAAVFGTTDVDQVFVVADEGVTDEELVATLNASLGDGLEAISGQDLADEFKDLVGTFTSIINTALTVFAAVALFVGAFVIYNTFSITVAQRTKEMALLRAIGASGRQVSTSVIVEALVVGIIASMLGAAVGIGLGWLLIKLLSAVSGDFAIALSIPPGTMISGVIIGTLITVFAAFVPARRGASVAPIEALRESAIEEVRASRTRAITGLVVLAVGLIASIAAVTGANTLWLGIGLPAIIFSVFLLGPVIVAPVTKVLAVPIARGGRITGELAQQNAARNPKRTATTSLTLMIGVALMVTATVFAATLSTSLRGDLEDELIATDVVEVGDAIAAIGGGLDPTIAPAIAAIDGVEASVPLRQAPAQIGTGFAQITGAATADLDLVLDLDVLDGTVTDLDATSIALDEGTADDLGVAVGETVDVTFQQTTVPLAVAGIYDGSEIVGDHLVDNVVLDANIPRSLDTRILVTADGSDEVRAEIEATLVGDPTASDKTRGEFISDQAGAINQLLILLYGLLGMSVLVALIGIVNTMALSIHERTRELGLLRAVGMHRTQLRRTIRYESALVALMGTAVGLVLGVFFGWLAKAAGGDSISTFDIPWGQLLVVAVVGVLAGVLAGVLPARRAGKLDVLEAIASE